MCLSGEIPTAANFSYMVCSNKYAASTAAKYAVNAVRN